MGAPDPGIDLESEKLIRQLHRELNGLTRRRPKEPSAQQLLQLPRRCVWSAAAQVTRQV